MSKKQRTQQYLGPSMSTLSIEDIFPCLTLIRDNTKVADDDHDWKNRLSKKPYVDSLTVVTPQPTNHPKNLHSAYHSTNTPSSLFKRPRCYDSDPRLHAELEFMFSQ
jgi:hypothetical protein